MREMVLVEVDAGQQLPFGFRELARAPKVADIVNTVESVAFLDREEARLTAQMHADKAAAVAETKCPRCDGSGYVQTGPKVAARCGECVRRARLLAGKPEAPDEDDDDTVLIVGGDPDPDATGRHVVNADPRQYDAA